MTKDQENIIDYLLSGLLKRIMSEQNISLQSALDLLYNSQLYENIMNVNTGLYIQSSCYNYELLQHEMQYGK